MIEDLDTSNSWIHWNPEISALRAVPAPHSHKVTEIDMNQMPHGWGYYWNTCTHLWHITEICAYIYIYIHVYIYIYIYIYLSIYILIRDIHTHTETYIQSVYHIQPPMGSIFKTIARIFSWWICRVLIWLRHTRGDIIQMTTWTLISKNISSKWRINFFRQHHQVAWRFFPWAQLVVHRSGTLNTSPSRSELILVDVTWWSWCR